MEFLQHWQPFLVFGLGLTVAIGGFVFRAYVVGLIQDRASKSELHDLSLGHAALMSRVATLEATITHLPTAEQMQALTLTMSDLRGDVKLVGVQVSGLSHNVDVQIESVKTSIQGLSRRLDTMDEHWKAS